MEDYKFKFGKNKEKTFLDVFENDKSYTDYILSQPILENKNFFKWYLKFLQKIRDETENQYNEEVEELFTHDKENRILRFGKHSLNLYTTTLDGREIDYSEEEISELKRILFVLSTNEFSSFKNCVYCEKIENNTKSSVKPCVYHRLKNQQTVNSKQSTYDFFKTMLKPHTEGENLFLRRCVSRMVEHRC